MQPIPSIQRFCKRLTLMELPTTTLESGSVTIHCGNMTFQPKTWNQALGVLFFKMGAAACALPLLLLAACHTPQENVVLIIVDDLGWKDIGVYGSTFYDTPAIDQLAASGPVIYHSTPPARFARRRERAS